VKITQFAFVIEKSTNTGRKMDATIEETFVGEIRRKSTRRTYKIEEVGAIRFYLPITQFI
jgi:hypothetical protein